MPLVQSAGSKYSCLANLESSLHVSFDYNPSLFIGDPSMFYLQIHFEIHFERSLMIVFDQSKIKKSRVLNDTFPKKIG